MRQAIATGTAPAEQSSVSIDNPYKVIDPIRTLRQELRLTSNDLVTLQALISFLPRKPGQVAAGMTIVFPSNNILSQRTNGLDERTIRRCIGRLVDAGLIQRRDSATRKRFPLRYGGVIRSAFGFDLAPMFRREAELRDRATSIDHNAERLRSLRAEAMALRVEALKQACDQDAIAFLTNARNTLRRATIKLQDIIDLIRQMATMIGSPRADHSVPAGNQRTEATMTGKMSAKTGQDDRLVEPTGSNKNKNDHQALPLPNPRLMSWRDLRNLSTFFPDEPRDRQSVWRIIAEAGSLLGIAPAKLMTLLQSCGPGRLLVALDALVEKAGEVRHPTAYLEAMLSSRLSDRESRNRTVAARTTAERGISWHLP